LVDHQVLVHELAAVGVGGLNVGDRCGRTENVVGPLTRQKRLNRALVEQIDLLPSGGNDVRVTAARQTTHQRRTH
jgi:hypothetical protein